MWNNTCLHRKFLRIKPWQLLGISTICWVTLYPRVLGGIPQRILFAMGYLFLCFFFGGRFWNYFWVPGSMLSCFFSFLLLCFSCFFASLLYLLLLFSASLLSLLLCSSAFVLYLLLFFSASLLFCFCASVPFYFYYCTSSFLQACVFVALLPAPLLLCFLSLLPLCFFLFFCFTLSCL